ncbi:class II fumarate hydratase [Methanolobus profundi]|uniref:Fumarate hydratase class II n=1 Tax=Methanolobus profundi TaxID=487685 RepID=A0A1I4RTK3_9EURY|nr:aspartate ammonia-lyase [Methanolobus profundi]SFM55501.1 fumarase, class II [Methanolobus profundi]
MRLEKDTLGEVEVPEDVYYGPQTARAVDNFQVSGERLPAEFIKAQAAIKIASAKANMELGKLDTHIGKSLVEAAYEVREGKLSDQFVVDAFQSGAGTSQNMNANEVIANRALEIMGYEKGRYDIIHPNDHVNMSQSSNDTTHTAIHIAAVETVYSSLLPAIDELLVILDEKKVGLMSIVKPGRTHLQDAVPLTMGQEFSGYFRMIELDMKRLLEAVDGLLELNMGGTAVGTGLNAPQGFSKIAIREMNSITGIGFRLAEDPFEATQAAGSILACSAALRGLAVSLTKIANDLRLLSSGPRAGMGELDLPAVQPGSSIMPGKVNPVMAEMLNMACFQVMGNDTTIMMAAQAGQLELNVFTPLLAHNILGSIRILSGSISSFNRKCLSGLTVNTERCAELAASSLAIATSLAPVIGYDKAAEVAYRAHNEGRTIKEVVIEMGLLDDHGVEHLLDPMELTGVKK